MTPRRYRAKPVILTGSGRHYICSPTSNINERDPLNNCTINLPEAQMAVRTYMNAGRPFEFVEEFIEGLSLETDAKAALWLYAWSYLAPYMQRDQAMQYIRSLEAEARE